MNIGPQTGYRLSAALTWCPQWL